MSRSIKGSCLCGQVAFAVEAEFNGMFFCHCSKCRKVTGSSNASLLGIAKSKLTWLSGRDKLASFRSPTGYFVVFCPACGSPLPKTKWDKIYLIPAGTLDGDPVISEKMHLFCDSKAPWHEITDGYQQYPEWSPSPE